MYFGGASGDYPFDLDQVWSNSNNSGVSLTPYSAPGVTIVGGNDTIPNTLESASMPAFAFLERAIRESFGVDELDHTKSNNGRTTDSHS